MSGNAQVYLRIKRRDKTFCLLCEESDTVLSVKEKLGKIILQFGNEQDGDDDGPPTMRLLQEKSQAVLHDADTLSAAKVVDNSVLHLVYSINDDDDEFEPVEVVETMPQMAAVGGAEKN
mmetsp:Transcript_26019/g.71664  ORF Transcript_26019/g.71664 Transcript_26019/m.71664 type:complete len:119 (+) Transcript_26019:160-516(+)|eukprot:CAMPEP_0168720664 /NCGR_PEP_ID=MMETSP0724-20121128/1681_1 /TAXON_ID=265536 /ORGANISM="Amphiprora sp., Strain CCMP467" /LENGTH=118 /DNA_ID=CAMNT_0008767277 /DNA_START=137 /DNA_END=493 /DNA_ORIENTATION=+